METVIKVENHSKQYRLGNVGLGSLGADVNRWWHTRILGNEDPYLKIGEESNREVIGTSEYVWALRKKPLNNQATTKRGWTLHARWPDKRAERSGCP